MTVGLRWCGVVARLGFVVALVLAVSKPAQATVVVDGRRKYELTIPDGFSPTAPEGEQTHAFRREGFSRAEIGVVIAMQPLRQELPQGMSPGAELVAQSPGSSVTIERWKTFEVGVVRSETMVRDRPAVLLQVRLPLAPEGLQISVTADRAAEADAMTIMRSLIADLRGEASWLTDDQTSSQRTKWLGYGVVALFIVAAGLLFRKLR